MGGYGDVKLLREDGKRLDGRAIDEMRPVTIEAGVLPAADGSAMVTHGLNVAVAAATEILSSQMSSDIAGKLTEDAISEVQTKFH